MATTAGNAALAIGEVTRFTEMRHRLLFLLGALVVYRIGTFVPVPGIDPVALARLFDSQEGTILGLFNMFSGGALQRLSIFAMGVMPYISASIILQMMAVVVPSMAAIKKEGESGRRKITQWTRYFTVLLAAFQGFAAAVAFQNQGVVINPGTFSFLLPAVLTARFGLSRSVFDYDNQGLGFKPSALDCPRRSTAWWTGRCFRGSARAGS